MPYESGTSTDFVHVTYIGILAKNTFRRGDVSSIRFVGAGKVDERNKNNEKSNNDNKKHTSKHTNKNKKTNTNTKTTVNKQRRKDAFNNKKNHNAL